MLCPAEAEAGKSRIFGSGLVSWNALQEAEGGYSKHSEFIKASTKHQHITPRTSGLENHPLSLKDTKCCFPIPVSFQDVQPARVIGWDRLVSPSAAP